MIRGPPPCDFPYCRASAIGRCQLSWRPFCYEHLQNHSPTGNDHPAHLFPPQLLLGPHCPECGGEVRELDGGELVACRSNDCGWMEVTA